MKPFKKMIWSMMTLLPISSIAFAAEYNLQIEDKPLDPKVVEEEFMQRLGDNQLPLKYYRYLQDHQIYNSDLLRSKEFEAQRKRMLDEYIKDFKDVYSRSSGTISEF